MTDYERDKLKKILKMQKSNYQIDSRLIKKDDIFFALKGDRTDGHLYLLEVAKKKAKAAVISSDYKYMESGKLVRMYYHDKTMDIFLRRMKNHG